MHIHHFVIVEKKWMVSGMLEINAQVTDNVNYINFNFCVKMRNWKATVTIIFVKIL
jgi:hypothetical protein